MRLFLVIILIGIILSSTVVSWRYDFFDSAEKVEWTKLLDGETEEHQEEIEKEKDKKLNYQTVISSKYSNHYHLPKWSDFLLFTFHYHKIITPPPEYI